MRSNPLIPLLFLMTVSAPLIAGHERPADPPLAGRARLVKNISTASPWPTVHFRSDIIPAGERGYFATNDVSSISSIGALWSTDGTAEGTKPILSLPDPSQRRPIENPVAAGGLLFFFASDDGRNWSVWRTDGSASGTFPVFRFPGFHAALLEMAAVGTRVFFSVERTYQSMELWTSDGTQEGTRFLKGFQGHTPEHLTAMGTTLFFSGWDELHGEELWRSDGTAEGTYLVKDLFPGPDNHGMPYRIVVYKGSLYFIAAMGWAGLTELWKSDGTEAGTVPVLTGETPPRPHLLTSAGGYLWFDSWSGNPQFWRSDGTSEGTFPVAAVSAMMDSRNQLGVAEYEGGILFSAWSAEWGTELWRSDGTPGGTILVKDLNTGPGDSSPCGFTRFGDRIYFVAEYAEYGSELWSTDGTGQGTSIFLDLDPGPPSSIPSGLAVLGDRLVFQAQAKLWSSDGTPAGTRAILELNTADGPTSFQGLVGWGTDEALFTALPLEGKIGLWASDGTPDGTTILTPPLISLSGLKAGSERAYFSARDNQHGNELWATDGTVEGTGLFLEIIPGAEGSIGYPFEGVEFGGGLVFSASDGIQGIEPWVIHEHPDTARMLADVYPEADWANGTESSWPQCFTPVGERVFFYATGEGLTEQVWASDGTPAGTRPVKVFDGDFRQMSILSPGASADTLFFFQKYWHDDQWALWRSDGTPEGTVELDHFDPDIESDLDPEISFNHGDSVLLAATKSGHGQELFISDGRLSGTELVKDINVGNAGSFPDSFTMLGDRSYFQADDGIHGTELWTSDGTEAGTNMLVDLCPGLCSGYPMGMVAGGGRLYFSATDGVHGHELWTTDGTVQGTTMVADIQAGPASSAPERITPSGPTVYFTADDGRTGRELWRYDPPRP